MKIVKVKRMLVIPNWTFIHGHGEREWPLLYHIAFPCLVHIYKNYQINITSMHSTTTIISTTLQFIWPVTVFMCTLHHEINYIILYIHVYILQYTIYIIYIVWWWHTCPTYGDIHVLYEFLLHLYAIAQY